VRCAWLAASTHSPEPCSDPAQKQFDFWVGEWDLTWPGDKSDETAHGTNSIKRILDGCIVEETFSGAAIPCTFEGAASQRSILAQASGSRPGSTMKAVISISAVNLKMAQ
jgi:hypothetical protein